MSEEDFKDCWLRRERFKLKLKELGVAEEEVHQFVHDTTFVAMCISDMRFDFKRVKGGIEVQGEFIPDTIS